MGLHKGTFKVARGAEQTLHYSRPSSLQSFAYLASGVYRSPRVHRNVWFSAFLKPDGKKCKKKQTHSTMRRPKAKKRETNVYVFIYCWRIISLRWMSVCVCGCVCLCVCAAQWMSFRLSDCGEKCAMNNIIYEPVPNTTCGKKKSDRTRSMPYIIDYLQILVIF